MAYVSEHTSTELRAHMRKLKKMPGWHEPLANRLFEEIQRQDAEIERLRARLGIVISALRQLEEATGESFDDDGGDIAGIEAELRAGRQLTQEGE